MRSIHTLSSFALTLCGLLFTPHLTRGQTIIAAPTSLQFNSTADSGTLPPPQTFQLTSPDGHVPFYMAAAPHNFKLGDPIFVSLDPPTGTTPATITVTLLPVGLSLNYGGYYNVILVVFGTSNLLAANVNVGLSVALPPPPKVTSVLNASSLQPGISPGTIITVFGDHIGPFIPSYHGGDSTVTFNGHGSPTLFANANQINAIVPYEIAGQTTVDMIVSHSLVAAPAIKVPVLDTSPGIFTATQSGNGQGAILNQNGTINSAANPAAPGATIQIYATGAGIWNPPVPTGRQIPSGPPYPVPAATPVLVSIGGQPALVSYAGAAPGFISGLLQVNAIVPAGLASGPQPVLLTIGQHINSPQQVTVAVQ